MEEENVMKQMRILWVVLPSGSVVMFYCSVRVLHGGLR